MLFSRKASSTKDQVLEILTEAPNAETFLMRSLLIIGKPIMSLSRSSRTILPRSWLLDILDFAISMYAARSWSVKSLLSKSPDKWDDVEWTKPIARCWNNIEELSREYNLFESLCEDPTGLYDLLRMPLITNAITGHNAFPKAAELCQHLAFRSFELARASLEKQRMLLFLIFAASLSEADQ